MSTESEINAKSTVITQVTTPDAILGAIIAKLRVEKKLTQSDIAKKIGIKPSVWSRIERGESPLSIKQLRIVSDALGETHWQLMKMAYEEEAHLANHGVIVVNSPSPKALAENITKDQKNGMSPSAWTKMSDGLGTMAGGAIAAAGTGLASGTGPAIGAGLATLGSATTLPIPIAGLALASILTVFLKGR